MTREQRSCLRVHREHKRVRSSGLLNSILKFLNEVLQYLILFLNQLLDFLEEHDTSQEELYRVNRLQTEKRRRKLKKEPLSRPWVNYARWLLLGLLLAILFITLSYLIPLLIGDFRFMRATGQRSMADYLMVPQWAELLFKKLLFLPLYAWHIPYSCAFTLPFGALLWLFGFPKCRLSDKII